jgi:hypothetical protein
MARRLVLQQQAEADVDDAMSWYESERPGLGIEFLQDLNVLLERVEANPFQFPIVHKETRRAGCSAVSRTVSSSPSPMNNSSFSLLCICIDIPIRGNVGDSFVGRTG